LKSANLTTPLLPLSSKIALDLFIPGNQPNPSSLGTVAMSVACPSTNFTSSFGQVNLNGLAVNAFSKLTFTVGSSAGTVLAQPRSDCTFITVTMNQTATKPAVDNLRFVP
jgi:hypothetical protein